MRSLPVGREIGRASVAIAEPPALSPGGCALALARSMLPERRRTRSRAAPWRRVVEVKKLWIGRLVAPDVQPEGGRGAGGVKLEAVKG